MPIDNIATKGAVINDVVIIGAGPAGCSLAIQLTKLGVTPLLVDTTGAAGGLVANAREIQNYLGLNGVTGSVFVSMMKEHLESFNIKVQAAEVHEISANKVQGSHAQAHSTFELKTSTGTIKARTVVLAVGTIPVTYETIDTNKKKNVFYDLVSLTQSPMFKKADKVVVIGGGESAFDYSLSLSSMGKKVLLFMRSSKPRVCGMLRDEVLRNAAEGSGSGNIKITYSAGPKTIEDSITEDTPALSAIGRKSAVEKIKMDFGLPHYGIFVIGNASSGTLGQTATACGEAIDTAEKIIAALNADDTTRGAANKEGTA